MDHYPRRPGSDESGREYEIKITALLSLRCISMNKTMDMWIGSNVDEVGDFDDIVIHNQTPDGSSIIYMIQLKHQETPKNITERDLLFSVKNSLGKKKKSKEDFSLTKYCEGYIKVKHKIDNPTEDELDIIKHLRIVNKIILVLYTNKGVNQCEFLSKMDDIAELKFLNTNNGNIYKFNDSKLNYNKDFLQQLVLFTNQSHANEVDKLIKKEIKTLTGFSKTDIDYKEVIHKFTNFIKIWIKETEIKTNSEDTKMHLTLKKEDIFNTLIDIILQPYKVNLGKDLLAPGDSLMWNDLLIDKTITIVDSDKTVLSFLKQYVANLVGNYCNGKTWIEDLSKNAQDLFYKQNHELKPQMFKIAGNVRNITMLDIYKCLWFTNQVPMLLEIQNNDDFTIIRKVLKLFKYSLKVIIINNAKESALKITDVPRHFISLKNLNNVDMDQILNFKVKLQGRPSRLLGDFIDKSMYEHIKCKDIIQILLGNYNIGNIYEPLSECFINRCLSKIVYKTKILKQVQDTFVICNSGGKIGYEDFVNCEVKYINLSNERNVILTDETNSNLKVGTGSVVHQLNCLRDTTGDSYLEWKESLGSTENIRQFQLIEPKTLNNPLRGWKLPQDIDEFWIELNDLSENYFSNTTIINACPGMGKSILMNFIALKAPANIWVMKINLNEHYDYYEKLRRVSNLKALDHLNYFNETILKKYVCENITLTEAVIKKLFNVKKILILLDGFDEISISYKDEVTDLALTLHEEGFPIWITTRPVMKQHLENHFDITSNTLKPFGSEDQKNFLVRFFGGINPTPNDLKLIQDFADRLLEAARNNLKDRGCEFTGIPLQTRLLAEAFKSDCEKSVQAGVINFDDKFDLLYLYEKFIDDKNNILCSKFGFGVKEMRIFFEKHQQLFALKTLFDDSDLSGLNLNEQLSEYYEDKQQKIQFLQREGVIVVEQSVSGSVETLDVNFVHRTFAEYLAAKWLSENFNSRNASIKETAMNLLKIRFDRLCRFPFLFNIFDRLVANKCSLHLAIINNRLDEATTIIKSNPEAINKIDKAGRTPLHIIAQYGVLHSETVLSSNIVHDELVNLIEYIPCDKITNVRDELYDYGPLDYAIASQSLAVANKLCEKSEILDFHVSISEKDIFFCYCDMYEYKYLFKIILPYFVSADLLLKRIAPNTTLEEYCILETNIPSQSDNTNIIEYAKERGVTTLVEMFQTKPNYYKDIQFASAFGTADNVCDLISDNVDVNEDDVHDNFPIHYAAIHGRLEILKLLLSEGADLDEPGEWGNTPLHFAAEFGHIEIIQELLARGTDINQQNREDDTPLLLAVMNNEIDTAKFLLSNGALGDIQNDLKESALHCAAHMGHLDLLSDLLETNSCKKVINRQHEFNRTLLHVALLGVWECESKDLENRKYIIDLLLNNGIDVNLQDELGETALFYASNCNMKHPNVTDDLRLFFEDLVILLLSKGADPNIKNCNRNTALDVAIKSEHINTVSVLKKVTNK